MMRIPITKLAYTIAEAMHATGHGRTTIYELIAAGELDARAAGSRTLITAESLMGYIERLPKAPIRIHISSDAAPKGGSPTNGGGQGAEGAGAKEKGAGQ